VWNTLENGVFYAMNRFYGVSFQRRTDIPTYHPDMRVYTVLDKDGSELALFYADPFARRTSRAARGWATSSSSRACSASSRWSTTRSTSRRRPRASRR
jgi:peptidyl-dipeptidase Dcp